jgi:hypothetical protein
MYLTYTKSSCMLLRVGLDASDSSDDAQAKVSAHAA